MQPVRACELYLSYGVTGGSLLTQFLVSEAYHIDFNRQAYFQRHRGFRMF